MHPHRGVQPRPGAGAAAHPAAPLVPQHLGLGRRAASREPPIAPGRDAARASSASSPTTATADRCATCRSHYRLGPRYLYGRRRRRRCCSPTTRPTRRASTARARTSRTPYVKDAFHRHIVDGETTRVNPATIGHQGVRCTTARRGPGRAARSSLRLRLTDKPTCRRRSPTSTRSSPQRRAEADEFYARDPPAAGHRRRAARPAPGARRPAVDQADLPLRRRRSGSTATTRRCRRRASRRTIRNAHWRHLNSMRVLSMPDKWEYPWFAAWDLAFHCVAARPRRSGVRQGPALAAAVRAVPAPQRPDPGLRVGVLRPEPAGPRLGGLARLQHGPHPHRQGRPRLPRALLPQAADQLRLVDQQGRPRGQQRLRGRLPRPRQHHRRRPQRAAAATAPCSSSPTPPAGWACSA